MATIATPRKRLRIGRKWIIIAGVLIALDRQEKATENGVDVEHSAVQYVRNQLGMQVCAIAKLADLLLYFSKNGGAEMRVHHERVFAYRQKYGVTEG